MYFYWGFYFLLYVQFACISIGVPFVGFFVISIGVSTVQFTPVASFSIRALTVQFTLVCISIGVSTFYCTVCLYF